MEDSVGNRYPLDTNTGSVASARLEQKVAGHHIELNELYKHKGEKR